MKYQFPKNHRKGSWKHPCRTTNQRKFQYSPTLLLCTKESQLEQTKIQSEWSCGIHSHKKHHTTSQYIRKI